MDYVKILQTNEDISIGKSSTLLFILLLNPQSKNRLKKIQCNLIDTCTELITSPNLLVKAFFTNLPICNSPNKGGYPNWPILYPQSKKIIITKKKFKKIIIKGLLG